MRIVFSIFLLVLISNGSAAQVESGTIVVVGVTPKKLVIAADSRRSVKGAAPNDDRCKIMALGHQLLAASTGNTEVRSLFTGWRNEDIIRSVFHKYDFTNKPTAVRVGEIADEWAKESLWRWSVLYREHPEVVRSAAEDGPVLVQALFASVYQNQILYAIRAVAFDDNSVSAGVITFAYACTPFCGLGETAVFDEFNLQTSPRAKEEAQKWSPSDVLLRSTDRITLRAIRLADLVAAYEPHGWVGGKIDAVELWQDGTIHWVARKETCSDNED